MSPPLTDRPAPRLSRRRLLRAAAVAGVPALAGCLVEGRSDHDCGSASRPSTDADPDGGDVDPVAYPAHDGDGLPDAEWVRAHERAYVRNKTMEREASVQDFAFLPVDSHAEATDGGRVIRVAYEYRYLTDQFVTHSPLVTAAYYVTEQGARRTADDGEEILTNLDPVEDGDTVVCFE